MPSNCTVGHTCLVAEFGYGLGGPDDRDTE